MANVEGVIGIGPSAADKESFFHHHISPFLAVGDRQSDIVYIHQLVYHKPKQNSSYFRKIFRNIGIYLATIS